MKPLRESLDEARVLFGRGDFFEAHETLEDAWRRTSGELRLGLQGLVQIAAAFHKIKQGPRGLPGAKELMAKGLTKLRAARGAAELAHARAWADGLDAVLAAWERGEFTGPPPDPGW